MKRVLISTLAVVCWASLAYAQAGRIAISPDPGLGSCVFVETGFVQVHCFHVNTSGATGSQWKLEHPANWTHFGDIWQFPTIIGNSNEGVSIGYGNCLSSPIYLGYCNYGASGNPPGCIWVGPDPHSLTGKIEGVDCNAQKTFPSGGQGYLNPDHTVSCWNTCFPVPVQGATWGQIKALYH